MPRIPVEVIGSFAQVQTTFIEAADFDDIMSKLHLHFWGIPFLLLCSCGTQCGSNLGKYRTLDELSQDDLNWLVSGNQEHERRISFG